MARATGLGDPDDVRPGEFGMSFSEKILAHALGPASSAHRDGASPHLC